MHRGRGTIRSMRYLLGLGNYTMGDDSIGLRIVEHIIQENLDRDFRAIDLSANAMNLLFYCAEETEKIVIVDAVDMGISPGEFRIFSPEDVDSFKPSTGMTTHESDILKVILMGKNLGYTIPPIQILGIQPETMTSVMELSHLLQSRMEVYISTALAAVMETE